MRAESELQKLNLELEDRVQHEVERKRGVGLGLYIVRQTVEKMMGGTVSATNRDDGVEFVLEV